VKAAEPLIDAVTGHEFLVHEAQLDAGDEHDLGSPLPYPLRPLGAVGEQRQDLAGAQFQGIGREPDLEPQLGGVAGRQLQPLRLTADELDGIAVQVITDDGQLPPDHPGVEALAGDLAVADKAGVVRHALGSHLPGPSCRVGSPGACP
jgi:hypothetical protein